MAWHELLSHKIYRLSDYYEELTTLENKQKYNQELAKMAEMNYQEWYDSFYCDHLDVYPSAKSMADIWHNAALGQDHQILDVIVCVSTDNLDVLGMCALEYNELEPRCQNINPDKIYLTNLLVIPSARSHGVGAGLIQYCSYWLQNRRPELTHLYLNCQQKIMPYYLKHGWQLSDTETGLPDWTEMYFRLPHKS